MTEQEIRDPNCSHGLTTPPGFRRVLGVEVWLNGQVYTDVETDGKEVVVLGDPPDESDSDEPLHNCDAMGCGWCHVILRIRDLDALKAEGTPDAG